MFLSALAGIAFLIGSVVILNYTYKIFQFYNLYFTVPKNPLQTYKLNTSTSGDKRKHDQEAWALITGSSGGIGLRYAKYLLSLGSGVIILAHEGIPEAEARLRKAHPKGAIKSFTFDCTTATVSDIEHLVDCIKDLPITILINNVGGSPIETPNFRPFKEYNVQGIDKHIDLNSRFMTHLTLLMIPLLTKNAQSKA
jgi:17beta-estradiol 17-dehydrogenase / very-long-chain 3-oxoacyl-CoA reductase